MDTFIYTNTRVKALDHDSYRIESHSKNSSWYLCFQDTVCDKDEIKDFHKNFNDPTKEFVTIEFEITHHNHRIEFEITKKESNTFFAIRVFGSCETYHAIESSICASAVNTFLNDVYEK